MLVVKTFGPKRVFLVHRTNMSGATIMHQTQHRTTPREFSTSERPSLRTVLYCVIGPRESLLRQCRRLSFKLPPTGEVDVHVSAKAHVTFLVPRRRWDGSETLVACMRFVLELDTGCTRVSKKKKQRITV